MPHQRIDPLPAIRLALFLHGIAGYSALTCLIGLLRSPHENLIVMTYDWPENISLLQLARRRQIRVLAEPVNSTRIEESVHQFEPDLLVSIHYRHLVPMTIIRSAKRGGINLHPSLLPRYRGAFSIPWAIINGERETGITFHFMTANFDEGPIVLQHRVPLSGQESAGAMFLQLIELGIARLPDAIVLAITAPPSARPQVGTPSYYPRRVPYDGVIDPSWPLDRVDRFIRALDFPGKEPAQLLLSNGPVSVRSLSEYRAAMAIATAAD